LCQARQWRPEVQVTATPAAGKATPSKVRVAVQMAAMIVVWGAALFGSAGRVDWPRGWFHYCLTNAGMIAGMLIVRRYNPGLWTERAKKHEGTKRFDKIFIRLHAPTIFLLPVVAGLDAVRFGWAPLPLWAMYPGLVLFGAGTSLVTWSAAVNPHLERMVRIQTDRGHRVICDGPYRFVRHPMYLGVILGNAAAPLILGSGWAFAVAFYDIVLFAWRAALEDRTLRAELPGYAEFTQQTRYRLVPGLW